MGGSVIGTPYTIFLSTLWKKLIFGKNVFSSSSRLNTLLIFGLARLTVFQLYQHPWSRTLRGCCTLGTLGWHLLATSLGADAEGRLGMAYVFTSCQMQEEEIENMETMISSTFPSCSTIPTLISYGNILEYKIFKECRNPTIVRINNKGLARLPSS